jgi:hypothetical protein
LALKHRYLKGLFFVFQDVKRIEASLSQFDGQIKSLDEKMRTLLAKQSQINNNINNWKQNLGTLVYETLKPEMDNYILEVICKLNKGRSKFYFKDRRALIQGTQISSKSD